jgi:hypothetical protein
MTVKSKPITIHHNKHLFSIFKSLVKVYQLYYEFYKVNIIEDRQRDTIFINILPAKGGEVSFYHWYEFLMTEIYDVIDLLWSYYSNIHNKADELEEYKSMIPGLMLESLWDELVNWKGDLDVFDDLLEYGKEITYIGMLIELQEAKSAEGESIYDDFSELTSSVQERLEQLYEEYDAMLLEAEEEDDKNVNEPEENKKSDEEENTKEDDTRGSEDNSIFRLPASTLAVETTTEVKTEEKVSKKEKKLKKSLVLVKKVESEDEGTTGIYRVKPLK